MTGEGEPMPGGHTAPVVRVGDTVRRVPGPWTPAVAALMTGLRAAGVPGVPEHRGLDEAGREVVAHVEGEVPVYPMPAWVWSDAVLVDVGRRLRQVHDASAALDLPSDGWRREAVEPVECVLHGDVAPYNAVFRDSRLHALIDWDHARPGPRRLDLGEAAYRFVPLASPENPDAPGPDPVEQWRRAEVLASAYGVDVRVAVQGAAEHLADLIGWTVTRVAAGDAALARTVELGHLATYEQDLQWVRDLLA